MQEVHCFLQRVPTPAPHDASPTSVTPIDHCVGACESQAELHRSITWLQQLDGLLGSAKAHPDGPVPLKGLAQGQLAPARQHGCPLRLERWGCPCWDDTTCLPCILTSSQSYEWYAQRYESTCRHTHSPVHKPKLEPPHPADLHQVSRRICRALRQDTWLAGAEQAASVEAHRSW